ncbi:MAG: hypothetical protein KAT65_20335 [Methanophagales archaeon]|nr:hypothetical protein [Methanophagales archaeon]
MKKYKEADIKIKRREVALETSNIYAIHGLRQFYERFIELVTKDALKQGKSDRTMQQVLTAILKKFGLRYDFRGLAEEIEELVSHPTVIDYVRLMEDNFLV